jgi:hypothetical protein
MRFRASIPLLRTTNGFLQQTSCEHEGQMHWDSGSPSPGEGKEFEAGGEALCLCCVDLRLFEWTVKDLVR